MSIQSNTINITKKDKKSMNEDLQKWLTEEAKEELSKKIKTKLKDKKPKGMCRICGRKTAKAVCIKCGKSICNACFFHIVGLCEKCISKDTVEEWKTRKTDWERVLGVDWVE